MLDLSSPSVRIVGILGMGGIGKTTLARVLSELLQHQFEAFCFLENISWEWSEGKNKSYLKEKLYSKLMEKRPDIKGLQPYRVELLKRTKVLIVLDDVMDREQLELLVGDRDCYGPGSRIIVTSRDANVLRYGDSIYEVPGLDSSESMRLLRLKVCLQENSWDDGSTKIASNVVNYARGSPLAIATLGSFLRRKRREDWEIELKRLSQFQSPTLLKVLKMSYDSLDRDTQNIFLDVACFFIGHNIDSAKEILHSCVYFADHDLDQLVVRSLISITDSNKLSMHGLVRELGLAIVMGESPNEPGRRSRLWEAEDISYVLRRNIATETVERISLDMTRIDEVDLLPSVFSKMRSLLMLRLRNRFATSKLQFPNGLRFLPNALRYLEWDGFPLKSLPLNFTGENLVVLKLQHGKIERLWDQAQNLENLKVIDLSFSKKLTQVPNLSRARKIESVTLSYCLCLREIPSYFGDLASLTSLNLKGCSSLERVLALPSSLVDVNMKRCTSLESLPSIIWTMKSVKRLGLAGCSKFGHSEEILEFLEKLKDNVQNLNASG